MVIAVAVIAFIVFMERAQRRILVQYPKRQVGNRMFGGDSTHMPLKINTSGVIPPIFASSHPADPGDHRRVLAAAAGRAGCRSSATSSRTASRCTWSLYAAMIIFFSYFYTAVVFNPEETADNLKKYGGFIPGIRPGQRHGRLFRPCADAADHGRRRSIWSRSACCRRFLISNYGLPFYFGGTSILIVVSVTMDTVTQIQSHLLAHQYEGLIKKAQRERDGDGETDPAGPAGRGQGHAGEAAAGPLRHRADLHRRHAARRGGRRQRRSGARPRR